MTPTNDPPLLSIEEGARLLKEAYQLLLPIELVVDLAILARGKRGAEKWILRQVTPGLEVDWSEFYIPTKKPGSDKWCLDCDEEGRYDWDYCPYCGGELVHHVDSAWIESEKDRLTAEYQNACIEELRRRKGRAA